MQLVAHGAPGDGTYILWRTMCAMRPQFPLGPRCSQRWMHEMREREKSSPPARYVRLQEGQWGVTGGCGGGEEGGSEVSERHSGGILFVLSVIVQQQLMRAEIPVRRHHPHVTPPPPHTASTDENLARGVTRPSGPHPPLCSLSLPLTRQLIRSNRLRTDWRRSQKGMGGKETGKGWHITEVKVFQTAVGEKLHP